MHYSYPALYRIAKILGFGILLLLPLTPIRSANPDSLQHVLQKLRTDHLTTAAKIDLCHQGLKYISPHHGKEETELRLYLAEALFDAGNYLHSIQELNLIRSKIEIPANPHRKDSAMRRLHIRLLFDLSQSNIFIRNYSEAINNLLYILERYVADTVADRGIMAQCYNNMGGIFMARGQNTAALEYYNRSLELFRKQQNLYGEGMLHGNIGNIYNSMGQPEEALRHYLQHYNILARTGKEDNQLTHSILNLGLAYYGLKQYRIADKYYNEALRLIEKHEYNHLKSYAYYNLAVNEKDMGNALLAQQYAKAGISAAQTNRNSRIYAELLKLAGELEENKGDYQAANRYLKQSYRLKDSIDKDETEEKLTLLAYQFDNYKEKQALLLQQRNLEIANKKLANRNLWIACLGFGILIAVIAISYLYKRIVKQYSINKQIKNQLNTTQDELSTRLSDVKKAKEKEIESTNKKILSISLRMNRMQESVASIKRNLAELKASPPLRTREKKLVEEIEYAINTIGPQNHWDEFDIYYRQTEQAFMHKLDEKYPQLTPHEKRLCAFIHLNFSTKEIAGITNRTPQAVDTAKSRLKKKISPDTDVSLYDIMRNL